MKNVQSLTALSAIVAFGWLAIPASLAESEAQFQASSSAVTMSDTEQSRQNSTQSHTQFDDEAARENNTSSSFEGGGPASTSYENLRNPQDLRAPNANLWGANQNAWGTTPGGTPAPAKLKEKAKTKSFSITQVPRTRVYATGYRIRRISPSHEVLVQSKTRTDKFAYRNLNRVQ